MFRSAVFALLTALALAGCKSEMELSLFASEIQAALEGATDRVGTAVVGVEAIQCPEKGPAALPALRSGFSKAEFIGCRDGGMDTFAEYRLQLPILAITEVRKMPAAMNVALVKTDTPMGVLFIDEERLQAIFDALPGEIQVHLTDDLMPSIRIRIHNDTAADWTVVVQGVFVDGVAKQLATDITLAPREETLVRLSDVGNAAIRGNRPILFLLEPK